MQNEVLLARPDVAADFPDVLRERRMVHPDVLILPSGAHMVGPLRLQSVTPEEFVVARDTAAQKRLGYLSSNTPDELREQGWICWLNPDRTVGYAMRPDGYIDNLFNAGGPKHEADFALFHTIKMGATTADHFDGHLTDL